MAAQIVDKVRVAALRRITGRYSLSAHRSVADSVEYDKAPWSYSDVEAA